MPIPWGWGQGWDRAGKCAVPQPWGAGVFMSKPTLWVCGAVRSRGLCLGCCAGDKGVEQDSSSDPFHPAA